MLPATEESRRAVAEMTDLEARADARLVRARKLMELGRWVIALDSILDAAAAVAKVVEIAARENAKSAGRAKGEGHG